MFFLFCFFSFLSVFSVCTTFGVKGKACTRALLGSAEVISMLYGIRT